MQHRKAVLGALLLALLAAAALFFADRGAAPDAAEPAKGPDAAAVAAAGALADADPEVADFGSLTREKVRAAAVASGAADAAGAPGVPVHLRVRLFVVNEYGERVPPPNCRGWLIQAQTWISATRAVSPHQAYADAQGVAEFTFADAVHVDWASCLPPDPRWGHSYVEQHHDFDGGATEEWELDLRPAGSASGLVLDAHDRPVAGAVVHVFNPSWTYGLDDWTAGYLTATTGADGRYRFPALGEGSWTFAVEPRQWLQYQPQLGGGSWGEDRADVTAGQAVEVGVLRVVAADGIEVEVVDANGKPVSGAHVWARPLRFADAALGVPVEERERVLEEAFLSGDDPVYDRFLSGGNWEELIAAAEEPAEGSAAEFWANETFSHPTDENGRARFAMPAGLWRFGCWHEMLEHESMERAAVETQVPGPLLRLRLPFRMRGFSGTFVHEDGQPAAGVSLGFERLDGSGSLYADVGSDGRFEYSAAPASGTWRLQAWGSDAAPCSWVVDLAQDPGGLFLLPRRAPLHLQFRTASGDPLNQQNGYLTIRALRWEMPAGPPGARVGEPVWTQNENQITANLQTDAQDFYLLPGSYEVRLLAYAWQGQWQEWGPYYEPLEVASWVVSPRPEPWVLTAEPAPTEPDDSLFARVRGVALNAATRDPLGDVEIQARRGAEVLGRAQASRDGSFELRLAPGAYVLTGQLRGFAPAELPSNFAAGLSEAELALQPGGEEVALRLRDREGHRLPPCELRIYASAQSSAPFAEYWCQDGSVHLESLPPGELTVEAIFFDAVTARGRLAAGGSGERELRLDLTRAELREKLRAAAGGDGDRR